MKYVVCWKYKNGLRPGHGKPMESEKLAIAWRDHGNKEFPDILHWISEKEK